MFMILIVIMIFGEAWPTRKIRSKIVIKSRIA